MPKRTRSVSRVRSRRVRRKLTFKKRKSVVKNVKTLPKQMRVRMRYCTVVQLDPAATGSDHHLFRANSIFDPDQTGTGHQPYTHDFYQQLYNHYRVEKSRIRVTFLPNGASGTPASTSAVVGIAIKDDTTVETDFDTIRETPGSRYRVNNVDGKQTVTYGYNSRKMFPANVDNQNAAFGNNPSEEAIYQVFMTGVTAGDPSAQTAVVQIDYTVRMWELKDLGQS